jgi:flagellar motor component MotA
LEGKFDMKKDILLIVSIFIFIILVGCDIRKTLSENEIKETLKTINSIVLKEDNWKNNYIYQVNEMYLINKNYESYYLKIIEADQKREFESNFLKLEDVIISLFNNNIESWQINGFEDIGS